uniref:Uncharacterized protein n=1 Tax=Phlebotomus papatasi TaxID=29031 RepID=A0A1B0DA67_PHLPP
MARLIPRSSEKLQFLGVCLIDSLEDEDFSSLQLLLEEYRANPSVIVKSMGYAAVHYVSGMENKTFANKASHLIFGEFDGDPNVQEVYGGMTPMHIAASNGNAVIFELLLQKGGNLEIVDEDGMAPLSYALQNRHAEVLEIAHKLIREQKLERKRQERGVLSPAIPSRLTPKNTAPNLDPSSPYYIYITHRRKTPSSATNSLQVPENKENDFVTPKKVNLFDLTSSNLQEFSKIYSEGSSSRKSFIESWRKKVYKSRSRESVNRTVEDIERMISYYDDLESNCQDLTSSPPPAETDTSTNVYTTANDSLADSALIRRSPRFSKDSVLQMVELYKHRDTENNIQFYEMKYRAPPSEDQKDKESDKNSSLSFAFNIPSDYETEALREELTALGDPPGPITKTTKQLYVKKLIQYKMNPELAQLAQKARDNIPKEKMKGIFQQPNNNWREGNVKTSFIYFLIDPRISNNLPATISRMKFEDAWLCFLKSIFYVGKGKCSRPYAHLYEAIKHFDDFYLHQHREQVPVTRNRKLTRIMNIWDSECGVVCLHVFHNILPVEAFTREASIIDCLGLEHLTNECSGKYYGPVESWPKRAKKQMAIGLLYKAMQIHLAEGENQLAPKDLLR